MLLQIKQSVSVEDASGSHLTWETDYSPDISCHLSSCGLLNDPWLQEKINFYQS